MSNNVVVTSDCILVFWGRSNLYLLLPHGSVESGSLQDYRGKFPLNHLEKAFLERYKSGYGAPINGLIRG